MPNQGSADDPGSPNADEPDAGVITVADAAPDEADAAALPDAAPEEPEACAVAMQLLDNADFDDGPGVWSETSGGYDQDGNPVEFAMVRDLPVGNPSGGYGAWLGGYVPPKGVTATDVLVQELAIPAGVTGLELSGQANVQSEEYWSGDDDTLAVELVDAQDQLIETLGVLSNHSETSGWVAFTLEPSANLAGRTVRLRLRGSFDADQLTNFFFDSLALTVTGCQ